MYLQEMLECLYIRLNCFALSIQWYHQEKRVKIDCFSNFCKFFVVLFLYHVHSCPFCLCLSKWAHSFTNMYEIVVCTAARCAFFIISFLKRDIHEKGLFCVVLCCFDIFHIILSHASFPLIGFLVSIDIVVAGIVWVCCTLFPVFLRWFRYVCGVFD